MLKVIGQVKLDYLKNSITFIKKNMDLLKIIF